MGCKCDGEETLCGTQRRKKNILPDDKMFPHGENSPFVNSVEEAFEDIKDVEMDIFDE